MSFQNVEAMSYFRMNYSKNFIYCFLIVALLINLQALANVEDENLPKVDTLIPSIESNDLSDENNNPTQVEIKKLPNFPTISRKSSSHRIGASATSIPLDTRLRMSVDSPADAKLSMIGDYFKAHILEDFYIPSTPPQLVVPKGAWVRGHISFIKKPSVFSMAGKIGLHLDQLVTPTGEVVPLDAELDIQQGIVNNQGILDPMTNYGTKALEPTQKLLDSNTGKAISVATLGTPVIGTLVAGSLTALFSYGDNITLTKGQELQIVLKKDIQLTIN